MPGTLFEEFGFNYIGPIDGHDLDSLIADAARTCKTLKGPQFLHVVTNKGQGYKLAEADPVAYHGVGKFDPAVGISRQAARRKPTYTQVFGDWLCDMAAARQAPGRHHAGDARRLGPGAISQERFPERYFDVGIAEQHAVTFAAGLACEGMKPVVAIYSTFLQRGYDQLIHDVAIQNLPVRVRARPRRPGRRRRRDARRRLRPRLPALRAEHDGDGARRRERVPADALHRRSRTDGPAAVRYPRGAGAGRGDRARR